MELVIVELDTGAELDATECTDVDEMWSAIHRGVCP
jgi:hypothetical protein